MPYELDAAATSAASINARSLFTTAPQHQPRTRKLDRMLKEGEEEDGEEHEVENEREPRKEPDESKGKAESSGSSSADARSAVGGGAAASGASSGSGSGSSSGSGSGSNSVARSTVPSVYPQVLALPITRRPLFPGFYKAVVIKNQAVCAAIKESLKRGQPYIGAFLLKDEEEDADVITDLSKVHKVGVFAQVTTSSPSRAAVRQEVARRARTARRSLMTRRASPPCSIRIAVSASTNSSPQQARPFLRLLQVPRVLVQQTQ